MSWMPCGVCSFWIFAEPSQSSCMSSSSDIRSLNQDKKSTCARKTPPQLSSPRCPCNNSSWLDNETTELLPNGKVPLQFARAKIDSRKRRPLSALPSLRAHARLASIFSRAHPPRPLENWPPRHSQNPHH